MMHCPRNGDGKLPVYQALKTRVMKDSSDLSSTAPAAGGNSDRCDHSPWRSRGWFRVSWPGVILRALHIRETSLKHLTVNGNKQKTIRAGVKGAACFPGL